MAPRLLAALALLAVVGLASTAQLDGGQALSTSELALIVVLLAVVAAVVLGVGALALGGGYAVFGESRRKLVAALGLTALLAALIALTLAPIDATLEGPRPVPESRDDDPADGTFRLGESAFDAIAVVVIVAVALVAAALVVLGAVGLTQRRRRRAATEPSEEEALLGTLEESLDDLRREPDVRRAIIACYARMERALELAGSGRRPAEAPFDYLVRILERITANGQAARALTELFERAKFSIEPMGEREKEQAIGALELLRAEVRPL